METLVSGINYKDDGHYHDASQHGLAWALLNELLHVIVFVFTLFGMIQFKVKFIRAIELVRWISRLIIAYNWYLSGKFALLALLMYAYNIKLEQQSIELTALNCSLQNYAKFRDDLSSMNENTQHNNNNNWLFHMDYLPYLTQVVDIFGGPYKLLGNRATLMYGVYSLAIYIMLAIFPLELMIFLEVGFNFIRFVLSDPGCMKDLYDKRTRHLSRLASWSRNQTDSLLTQGAKMILNQRELRTIYTADFHTQQSGAGGSGPPWSRFRSPPSLTQWLSENRGSLAGGASSPASVTGHPSPLEGFEAFEFGAKFNNDEKEAKDFDLVGWAENLKEPSPQVGPNYHHYHHQHNHLEDQVQSRCLTRVKQLRTRLAINHLDRPRYQVVVANRNLQRFKPFVRSDNWFKASMIIYPIFIFYNFISLIFVIGLIQWYFETALCDVVKTCVKANRDINNTEWVHTWSMLDRLTYYENIYTVIVLSCASSFYCSYFFGTILELSIWMREISQQLALSTHVIELTDVLVHSTGELSSMQARRLLSSSVRHSRVMIGYYVNDFGGLNELFPDFKSRQIVSKFLQQVKRALGQILCLGLHEKSRAGQKTKRNTSVWPHRAPSKSNLRELMSIRLLTKKETLLRATYVNMCLFFDELHETRFMTTTILRRTTQLCSGFAFMASITRSQFKANYSHLNYLLLTSLIIFNVYLACAAFINSCVNKMLVQIHSLISASLRTGSEDADLFEFWLRHVGSFGQDKDVTAYNIYGYKVTWSTIMNVSVCEIIREGAE